MPPLIPFDDITHLFTEAAFRWWERRGRPGFERFGLTVGADGQRAWLDDPEDFWPV